MPNPYFDSLGFQESPLYDDLIRESIYNHGIGAKYLPKSIFNTDEVLGKVDGEFKEAFDLDVVIVETANFNEASQVYNNFGLFIDKTATIAIHKGEFDRIVQQEPKPGDVVYLPQWDLYFEVLEPASMNVLQFASNFVYLMYCKLFESKGEAFITGDPEIDKASNIYQDNLSDDEIQGITNRFNSLVEFNKDNPFSGTF